MDDERLSNGGLLNSIVNSCSELLKEEGEMRRFLTTILMVLLTVCLFFSCDLAGTDGTDGTDGSDNPDGTDSLSVDVPGAVLELPKSILPVETTARSVDDQAEGDISDIYSLIPGYVGTASDIRGFVVELMGDVFASLDYLDGLTRDEVVVVEYGDFPKMMISDSAGTYGHKIVLYADDLAEIPGMVVYYTLDEDAGTAMGTVLLTDTETAFPGTTEIEKSYSAEIVFDNTGDTETLSIRYHCDLTDLITHAENTYSDLAPLTDTQAAEVRDLDLAQPERIAVEVSFDGTDYLISGYSYHPGIAVLSDLELEVYHDVFVRDLDDSGAFEDGEYRYTYLFKAHALVDEDGEEVGAKVALAFPADDAEAADVTDTFTDDALGVFYTDFMVRWLNEEVLGTEEDVLRKNYYILWLKDMLPTVSENASLDETRYDMFVAMITELYARIGGTDGSGVDLADANTYLTSLDYEAASRTSGVRREDIEIYLSFLGGSLSDSETEPLDQTNLDRLQAGIQENYDSVRGYSYTQVNTHYQGMATEQEQQDFLYAVYLPDMVDQAIATGYEITKTELAAFFERDDLDADAEAFRELYTSVEYIVNPAFYHPDDGFFATLNEGDPADSEDDELYVLEGDRLDLDDDGTETRDDPLLGLDLNDTITTLVPAVEGAFAIVVE